MQTSLLYSLNNSNVATSIVDSEYGRHKSIQVQFLSKPLEKTGGILDQAYQMAPERFSELPNASTSVYESSGY